MQTTSRKQSTKVAKPIRVLQGLFLVYVCMINVQRFPDQIPRHQIPHNVRTRARTRADLEPCCSCCNATHAQQVMNRCGIFEAFCRHTVCTGAALAIYAAQTTLQNVGHLASGVHAQRAKIIRIGQIGVRAPENKQSRISQVTIWACKELKRFRCTVHSHCSSHCSSQPLLSTPRACNWL